MNLTINSSHPILFSGKCKNKCWRAGTESLEQIKGCLHAKLPDIGIPLSWKRSIYWTLIPYEFCLHFINAWINWENVNILIHNELVYHIHSGALDMIQQVGREKTISTMGWRKCRKFFLSFCLKQHMHTEENGKHNRKCGTSQEKKLPC